MDASAVAHFREFGFVCLPALFDPAPIGHEVRRALADAFGARTHRNASAEATFRYVPMMCERTPVSLDLVGRFAELAGQLMSSSVLPGRAKGTEYSGSTGWHRDADGPVSGVGFLCYLDRLDEQSGALQVVPGSHLPNPAATARRQIAGDRADAGVHLPTSPGDAIVLDERVLHASVGGTIRHQWRVDFVADAGSDEDLHAYYAGQHPVDWDGGYDPALFPSYGPAWRELNSRWVNRLEELGVLDLVDAEERRMHRSDDPSGDDSGRDQHR